MNVAASTTAPSDYLAKIVSPERLSEILADFRNGNQPSRPPCIVQCHGCFDIVHPGHIRYLRFAKSQGDILIVSITGDACIDKGAQRPYIPEELRAENLAAFAFVDFVVVDPHPTAAQILQSLRPNLYVKGREYATSTDARFLEERRVVEAYGGRVVFSSGDVVFSSSRIVSSLTAEADLDAQRLSAVCRRHDITSRRIRGLLSGAAGRGIVIVGDVVIERYVHCDAPGISTESPMMALRELDAHDYVGGAGQAAMQAAALGARTTLVTSLSDDAPSEWLRSTLASAGVIVLSVDRALSPSVRTRFLVDNQKLLRVERGNAAATDSVDERKSIGLLASAAEGADAVLFRDEGYGVISPGLLRAFDERDRMGVRFVAGTCGETQPSLALFQRFDALCCSEKRLRMATNDRDGSLSTLAYKILESTDSRQLIVTLGKRGLVTFDRPSHDRAQPSWKWRLLSEHLPSFARSAIDDFGAGDSFFTTAIACLAGPATLMQAAYAGAIAASVAVERSGPTAIPIDEIFRRLDSRTELCDEPGTSRVVATAETPIAGTPHASQLVRL